MLTKSYDLIKYKVKEDIDQDTSVENVSKNLITLYLGLAPLK